jgi:hypothetical protein
MLLKTKHLSQPPLGAGPLNGISHRGNRRHNANPSSRMWNGWGSGKITPKREQSPIRAYAQFPNRANVVLTAQMLLGAEPHEKERRLPRRWAAGSNDRQTLATLEPAGFDDFLTTLGGHAGAIADLTGAFLAVRAKGGLHVCEPLRGKEVPESRGGVKAGLFNWRCPLS